MSIKVTSPDHKVSEAVSAYTQAFSRHSGHPTLHEVIKSSSHSFTATEAATLMCFPFVSHPGIRYKPWVRFGTALYEAIPDSTVINLGCLEDHHDTKLPVSISSKDLTRHALVVGVTGSGKTTTIKHILTDCAGKGIPFLVVEPAKSEYCNIGTIDVTVYRLGEYSLNPLRMNPLAFPEGVNVQTHLDLVKAVFNAAFPMYGPMPYLLETALVMAYRRKGWDLITGLNVNMTKRELLFPTLEELRDCIDLVTTSAGYSQELTADVRAALRVRIGSLMSGAKGQLLNCREPLDTTLLLSRPSVIELEAIGDGQEKVFLMGLQIGRAHV